MEPKVGDRVSLDAKKVGQPRRSGVVRNVIKGLSGVRYQIRWDDETESMIFPGAGILQVESGGAKRAPKAAAAPARAVKAAPKRAVKAATRATSKVTRKAKAQVSAVKSRGAKPSKAKAKAAKGSAKKRRR